MSKEEHIFPIRVTVNSPEHFVMKRICDVYRPFITSEGEFIDTETNKKIGQGYLKCLLKEDWESECTKNGTRFDVSRINKAIKFIFAGFDRMSAGIRKNPNVTMKGQSVVSTRAFYNEFLEKG